MIWNEISAYDVMFILHLIFMQEKSIDKCVKSKWCEKEKKSYNISNLYATSQDIH